MNVNHAIVRMRRVCGHGQVGLHPRGRSGRPRMFVGVLDHDLGAAYRVYVILGKRGLWQQRSEPRYNSDNEHC